MEEKDLLAVGQQVIDWAKALEVAIPEAKLEAFLAHRETILAVDAALHKVLAIAAGDDPMVLAWNELVVAATHLRLAWHHLGGGPIVEPK